MRQLGLIVGCSVILFSGCHGTPLGSRLCQVEGTVELRGEPLTDAWVVFVPKFPEPSEAAMLPLAYGRTDPDGRYRLQTSTQTMGAPPGAYFVMISQKQSAEAANGTASRELLDATFNRRTKLAAVVPSAPSATLDWKLE